ncbi:MAG: hypothetical protein WC428_08375 [Candidatus Paceibacterota bacterium]
MTTSDKTKHREKLIKQPEETTIIQETQNRITLIVCEKCRTALPVAMIKYQYEYCPSCGRKIIEKPS